MLVAIGQIARVNSDWFLALFALVRELALETIDAIGLLVAQHVTLARQIGVAMPAQEVVDVITFVHRLQVFVGEDQLLGPFFERINDRHRDVEQCCCVCVCGLCNILGLMLYEVFNCSFVSVVCLCDLNFFQLFV